MPRKPKAHPGTAEKSHSPKQNKQAGWLEKSSREDRRQKRGWNRGRK